MLARALVAGVLGAALLVVPAGPVHASSPPAPCSAGLIALTFDDGPAPQTTARMLDVLTARQVPATFFMVGSRIKAHPALARKVARLGFVIGDHTFLHQYLTTLTNAGIRSTLARTRRALRQAGVHPAPLMRPPYRATNARVERVADSMGLTQVLWTIDSRDWESGKAEAIASRVLRALQPHQPNIVLLHDGIVRSTITLKAVPKIIDRARLRGYCFAALGPDGRPDPPVPTVHASAPQVTEGTAGESRPATVTLTLDQPTSRRVSLRVHTVPVTAVEGEDFQGVSQRVVFPVGTTERTIAISVLGDDSSEGTETFLVALDRPNRLRVGKATLTVTILDDDAVQPFGGEGTAFPPPVEAWAAGLPQPLVAGSGSALRPLAGSGADDSSDLAVNLGLLMVVAAASWLALRRRPWFR